MPHINRIRVNNVKYNFGTQFYDDFVMRFSGKNTIYDLANGGGKSVLMLLLLQNLIPNCTLDEKQPIEKLFRSGNGNTTIHSMIEWKLNPCHVKNGFQYMLTGFCARKARGNSEEDGDERSSRASIDYFNYCIFYRGFNDNDLKNLPLSNGKERITYLGLRAYLQELEKKDFHVEVKIFDRKGEYQSFISQYGLFESEWEIIRGINKTEGHVRTYFETNYRTTRKVVEDLLIEEIIEKSFYHKTGIDREAGGMASTLLDLKEQLILLSKKKNEIHYYDSQIELLEEFAAKTQKLQGMYLKKQGLEEQLAKTYHTTLQRRKQKEQAHEECMQKREELKQQKQESACKIAVADIQKKEFELRKLESESEELGRRIEEITLAGEKKRLSLEERECDNYFLNYQEYEKDYLAAQKAVEEILSGSDTLEEDLFAMANELDVYVKQEEAELAKQIVEIQEQLSLLEEERSEAQLQEKDVSVNLQVLKQNLEKLEKEKTQVSAEIGELFAKESRLFFADSKKQQEEERLAIEEDEKKKDLLEKKLIQCGREISAALTEKRACQKEEQALELELTGLEKEMENYDGLRGRMEQLIAIYGGTDQSVENIIFQQQKELVLAHGKYLEEKKRCSARLAAMAEGIFAPQPENVTACLEEIARYYDETAVSGYEYLRQSDEQERQLMLQRYPQLPHAIVISKDMERIAADEKLQEKDFGDGLVPIISRQALERQTEFWDETAMIFLGAKVNREVLKARLKALEEIFAKQYERERILQQDYNFVRLYLKETEEFFVKKEKYRETERRLVAVKTAGEEIAENIKRLKKAEEELSLEVVQLEDNLKGRRELLKYLQILESLEKRREEMEAEYRRISALQQKTGERLWQIRQMLQELEQKQDTAGRSLAAKRQQLKGVMESRDIFKRYINSRKYPDTGLDRKELEVVFLGKKEAYEQKNADISDKQKLMDSFKKAMEQQREQLQLRGRTIEEMQQKHQNTGCAHTEMEELLVLKNEVMECRHRLLILQKEKSHLDIGIHRMLGSMQQAKQTAEEEYGELPKLQIAPEQVELFVRTEKALLQKISEDMESGEKILRQLEEQCYALKAMAQDMERMMKSTGIDPERIRECLETGSSLKEQYENLRQEYEKIVKEENERLETIEKEKQHLMIALEKMDAYELAEEIRKNIQMPKNEYQIKEQIEMLQAVTECLELEKVRIGKDMDSLQGLKDQFENQCLQNCLNIKEELDRLQKLSKISLDDQMVSMITLQVPYIKEEMYVSAMSEYIDRIIRDVEGFRNQEEQLNFIRGRLAFKKLFSVIVTNMDAIRLTLYKRERMKEQSRYLKYEEAVGSTGQSQGIYIQFLVAIINYISSINSQNADPLELKKVIFIDNPFGAAKDVYIWEPIFKLLRANNVQLIVPARGATPAITGHFEVNYILGQKLIDGRQQTVVVDYRSQTEESELEYSVLEYEQETLFSM